MKHIEKANPTISSPLLHLALIAYLKTDRVNSSSTHSQTALIFFLSSAPYTLPIPPPFLCIITLVLFEGGFVFHMHIFIHEIYLAD